MKFDTISIGDNSVVSYLISQFEITRLLAIYLELFMHFLAISTTDDRPMSYLIHRFGFN